MPVTGVVGHVVDEDPEAALVGRGEQRIEVVERSEQRVDIGVVGDVVAEVGHRRWVERRDPDGVHAQPREVVEAAGDAGEVSGAIAIGVGEAPWIDLVDDAGLPPVRLLLLHATKARQMPCGLLGLLRSVGDDRYARRQHAHR